jgi:hypothetical protein
LISVIRLQHHLTHTIYGPDQQSEHPSDDELDGTHQQGTVRVDDEANNFFDDGQATAQVSTEVTKQKHGTDLSTRMNRKPFSVVCTDTTIPSFTFSAIARCNPPFPNQFAACSTPLHVANI